MIYSLNDCRPKIDNSVFITDNATIVGDVQLAKNVSIWFNAVLRGDIASIIIGENSNVQDNSTIHTDSDIPCVVGRNVTIGHNVILHSCHIADNVIIGMGSTILNQANIAKNCIVGANSLVTHTLPYEEGVLIMGQPAKIVRKLTVNEIAHIAINATHYVENGQRYRQQLRIAK
ncbi:MAG: gamma carbonic anhydrase family protein [Candidatus Schmidhempelia sp.]|nr:gamma carbonic anhydrase family protein [Candidatus Schmidhempelia sp.]